jgi:hypothetical protein
MVTTLDKGAVLPEYVAQACSWRSDIDIESETESGFASGYETLSLRLYKRIASSIAAQHTCRCTIQEPIV